MKTIEKIKLQNFRRFRDFSVKFTSPRTILVGENEAGKSSILLAINLVLSASRTQAETIGAERLLNVTAVQEFMASARNYADLPVLFVELYFNDHGNIELEGRNNSEGVTCHGLRMTCAPNNPLSAEIRAILAKPDAVFPYDYYDVSFTSFQGDAYSGGRRFARHLTIDTSSGNAEYATRDYIARMYKAHAQPVEQSGHQHAYRSLKDNYKANVLFDLNGRTEEYQFALRTDAKSNLMTDLTLMQGDVGIDSKGKGLQCFIKTKFALKRAANPNQALDIILIEEPENHLSHANMHRLIGEIAQTDDKQLIIATHSNMISARLDLRNAIMLQSSSPAAATLEDLDPETAKFFVKAPDHGVLDFVLAKKALLVEGDAEHILMEQLFEAITGQKLADHDAHVLSVGGISFKRYLDIAKILRKRVAVLRDNDGDYQAKCVDEFADYSDQHIRIFGDRNPENRTFEICLYQANAAICEAVLAAPRRRLPIQEYMLKNKTEAAYALLNSDRALTVPAYIRDAIEWLVA
ncbi:ATP-dependent nuclease [Nevskia ramosa]|uniref:ATP-dependent nuclease n=1 Tax=Nevskia ramosa TaxID=64002 RepID=UPI0003B2E292|nr:AAA family ATPase [Nevskia ramosa]